MTTGDLPSVKGTSFFSLRTARDRTRLATLVLLLLLAAVAGLATWRAESDKQANRDLDRRTAVVTSLDEVRAQTYLSIAQLAASIFSETPTPINGIAAQAAQVEEYLNTARTQLIALGDTDKVAAVDSLDAEMNQILVDPDITAILAALNSGPKNRDGEAVLSARLAQSTAFDGRCEPPHSQGAQRAYRRALRCNCYCKYHARVCSSGSARWRSWARRSRSIVLVMSVMRSLTSLKASARAVASGDMTARASVSGPEEVASLARDFNDMVEQRMRAEEALRDLAATDSLTALPQSPLPLRVHLRQVETSLRDEEPVAVLLLDVDGFKLFNDTYGHQEGDQVLRQVARVLERELKDGEIAGRYGGDEFMVIMPRTDREQAIACANRIMAAVADERVQPREGRFLPLSVSIGLAVCPDDSQHKEELIAYADASLLEAKQLSGSKLVVAHQDNDDVLSRRRTPFGTLDALVRAVDRKDSYTRQHSQQNAEFAVELGKIVGLSNGAVDALRIGGLLHDVGKIGVPNDILRKPGPLNEEELAIMREHVVLSNLIVHGVPNLQDVSDAVYNHHERWDGQGYPRGLKGDEIPISGRIMALVDAYSAMILDRPYRKAMTYEQAVAELRKNSGSQFDPALVEPFIALLDYKQAAAA